MRGKIGVVGFYGYGNFGDEWMLAVMRLLAPDIEFVPFARRESKWEIDESVDALIIGGGDLLIYPRSWSIIFQQPIFGNEQTDNCFWSWNSPYLRLSLRGDRSFKFLFIASCSEGGMV
jgi:hypothetical protein